ncbi:hypothetical protein [Flavobacterium nitrogenifigens]|uniref:Uncharacterized protein n=1 Tax=Flavobacterium nitrogenifigens TaxID=1617283 RepID=A0A521AEK2_9FLAO|nr:hypothetical protein [Flavobacterium nitrogenifigens]KAF2331471.1 hypothetical protein DM397_12090 [Flavobacterium nitrogenifigens]SMO33206.1 hypothetical protein SAMN06265220_10165 [Flavobacterium nitrogenifigens]
MGKIKVLIKPTIISETVGFGGNIDPDQLAPSIIIAQTTYLKRILGIDLYDKISSDYSAGTLTGIYQTIYTDYVIDMLTFFSCSVYLSINTSKTTNAGTYRVGAEGSTNTPLNELTILGKTYESIGISYEQNFYSFIAKNPVPEYGQNNDTKNTTNLIGWY